MLLLVFCVDVIVLDGFIYIVCYVKAGLVTIYMGNCCSHGSLVTADLCCLFTQVALGGIWD